MYSQFYSHYHFQNELWYKNSSQLTIKAKHWNLDWNLHTPLTPLNMLVPLIKIDANNKIFILFILLFLFLGQSILLQLPYLLVLGKSVETTHVIIVCYNHTITIKQPTGSRKLPLSNILRWDIVIWNVCVYSQSSPTGPAEHCAGGSLCRSCSSCSAQQKYCS